jgi:hypothetical protein
MDGLTAGARAAPVRGRATIQHPPSCVVQGRGGDGSPPWEEPTMPAESTLLDLVTAVSEYATTESEVVATIVHLVNSGRVRLCGNFRGAKFDLRDVRAAGVAAA